MNKLSLSFVALFACGTDPLVEPPTTSPPPWGVPISGGTMHVTRDGRHAVIADLDRDRLLAVELASSRTTELALEPGDEPGRVIEDGAGRIHVALRRGGAIVTLESAAAFAIAHRRAVCAEPRGLAWESSTDAIHVACTGGELVTFPAAAGDATRRLVLDRDLRDVVIANGQLVVSRFRSAELLSIDAQGAITSRAEPPSVRRRGEQLEDPVNDGIVDAFPAVAWRTIVLPDETLVITHQRQTPRPLSKGFSGYGEQPCAGSPLEAALTIVPPNGAPQAVHPLRFGALPVDIAARADGAVAVLYASADLVTVLSPANLRDRDRDEEEDCPNGTGPEAHYGSTKLGNPTSLAFTPSGALLVYYPELPALVVREADKTMRTIQLPGPTGVDSGRRLFHAQTSSGLACASCHPEAREDGLVWNFAELGPRRTQSLAGNILSRAPYHWSGDMADLPALLDEVLLRRMGGGAPMTESARASLGPWLDRIPAAAPLAMTNPDAVDRGRALFESQEVGCTECHAGAVYSNSRIYNVGTGQLMKVPSLLGVGTRAPYLHDGCAPTLLERFGWCGGGDLHGKTSQLSTDQLADLVAFLESL